MERKTFKNNKKELSKLIFGDVYENVPVTKTLEFLKEDSNYSDEDLGNILSDRDTKDPFDLSIREIVNCLHINF
jgi:hypothetical protein